VRERRARAKAAAAVAPLRRFGAPQRREGRRSPRRSALAEPLVSRASVVECASPLALFRADDAFCESVSVARAKAAAAVSRASFGGQETPPRRRAHELA